MFKSATLIGMAGILAVTLSSAAMAEASFLLGDRGWESFVGEQSAASLAWAGENESFALSSLSDAVDLAWQTESLDGSVDVQLMTGVAAPEPPALVLAGLAFGGVLCGRSLVTRRRKAGVGVKEVGA